jgi:isopentenyl diphosphate isomerase/L-lactate dehydrogenase-like FMN-dependent dehydrogenase|tara:strand:+ start:2727 stop:3824 length:1098 start_codon:yes stop_codon:yes gene_type:complete
MVMNWLNLSELENLAKKQIEPTAFDYIASGANDEITLNNNVEAYKKIQLLPRRLSSNANPITKINIIGQDMSYPIIIAPTAFHGLANKKAENATAQAAQQTDTTMVLSTLSNTTIEDAAQSNANMWFQLYIFKDKKITLELIKKAESSNYKALVITIDAPILGKRERDIRNEFHLPNHLSIANLTEHMQEAELGQLKSASSLEQFFKEQLDNSLSWKDIDWLSSQTKLPILLKGILHPDDAKLALQAKVSGIIVSNHGGRQLDTAISTIEALPGIAKIINKEIPLLIDGGIRRGSDILKAIALGADAVLIGRPIIWGLADDGINGIKDVINFLRDELKQSMQLVGCKNINDLTAEIIRKTTNQDT